MSDDYYEILGVDRAESPQGVHTAYRKLAKQYHPDLVGGHSKEKFQGIQEAYEVLSDPDKRKHYDARIQKVARRKRTIGIEPEPLTPSQYRPSVTYPEPLVGNACPVEDLFSSSASHGPFCHGTQATDDEIFRFLMNAFRFFRFERF